jgi:hypothetical protein
MLPGVRQAVAVAEARAHVASLVGPVDIEPHDALQLALALTAAEVNYFSARIAELGNDEVAGQATITKTRAGASGDGDGDDKAPAVVETRQLAPSLHLWVKARSDALERLARFSKMALDANVDERRVRVQEVQLDRLAGVVNAVMRDLQAAGLSAELRSLAGDSCAGQTPTTQDRPARRLRLLRLERCCPTGAVRAAPARIRRVGRATPRPN